MRISYEYGKDNQLLIDRARTRIDEIEASYKAECAKYPQQAEEIMRKFREDKCIKSIQWLLHEMLVKSNPSLIIQVENDEEKKILEDYYKEHGNR